ncbi:hypothetical protein PUR61_31070 [Streptomyces sp. BE20]|uniref:hypothetical protein n=1 Tax=Streptomyces sp. BE20 TaxID=3002525 RepID=UPI002E79F99B|nr:hypothetical protein [Streptomyces sp. BE20]MEE1826598.1 hypothetical protein [Streptomyces sp. BE20]
MGRTTAVVEAEERTSAWALRRVVARLRTDLRAPGRGGEAVPGAVPLLVRMLRSARGRTRGEALRLLTELAEHPAAYWWPIAELGGPAVLAPVVPEAVRAVADTDPDVRAAAPQVLRWLGADDPAVPAALRAQAGRETDAGVLAGQLAVLVALLPSAAGTVPTGAVAGGALPGRAVSGGTGDRAGTGDEPDDADWYQWFARWLGHPSPAVRLAALAGRLRLRPGTDGTELGTLAAVALSDAEDLPWPAVGLLHAMTAEALADRPNESRALADALLRMEPSSRQSAGQRAGWALDRAARTVTDRRADTADLYALAAQHLDHPGWQARESAARLLTGAGSAAAPYADLLAQRLLVRLPTHHGRPEAFALAHLGDRRVLTYLRHRLRGSDYDLAIGRLVGSHPGEADTLLPAVGVALQEEDGLARAGALEALAAWGPVAAPVVPRMVKLLETGEARRTAAALGAIGPAAERAAPRLRELADGVGVPAVGAPRPRDPRALPWHGTQTAAWALWRVTGDHLKALEVLGAAAEAGPGRPHLSYLADLGPQAVRHAGAVRALLTSPGERTRVEAAHAWWRLTGEPGPAVDALVGELTGERAVARRLRGARAAAGPGAMVPARAAGEYDDELSAVLRHLTAIGRPAAAAVPVLEAYVEGHERILGGVMLTPLRDERLTAAAGEALAAIRGG